MKKIIRVVLLLFVLAVFDILILLGLGSSLLLFSNSSASVGNVAVALYIVISLVLCTLGSLWIISAFNKERVTRWRYLLLTITGIVLAGLFLVVRNEVPQYLSHKKQVKENEELEQFHQNLPEMLRVGQPIYEARKETENVPIGVNEYRLEVTIPVSINKPFTYTHILNSFALVWSSQAPKIIPPPLPNCQTDSLGNHYTVIPVLDSDTYPAGDYTLVFHYNYFSNSNNPSYQNCQLEEARAWIGETIILLQADNKAEIKTDVIRQITFN